MDDFDQRSFMNSLNRVLVDSGALLLAYCLMGKYFNLVIKVGEVRLSTMMRNLLTCCSKDFNRRHDRVGHLFQARHEAILCLDDLYLAALIRYIHLIPVRAGLVARPQDWPWSSHGGRDDDGAGLEGFDPWRGTSESPLSKEKEASQSIAEIGEAVALHAGIGTDLLRSGCRRRNILEARCLVTREAVRHGHALYRVAEWLHVVPSTMTRYMKKKLCKERQA